MVNCRRVRIGRVRGQSDKMKRFGLSTDRTAIKAAPAKGSLTLARGMVVVLNQPATYRKCAMPLARCW